MMHDSETMDKLIELCDAATTTFAEFIEVEHIRYWLAVRLKGHAGAMQTARFNVIPAVVAVNDIETFRTHMMDSEKLLHRKLEIRINDCVVWRLQFHVPLGDREKYMAALELAFSTSMITYGWNSFANIQQAYHENVGKHFKDEAFRSRGTVNKTTKRMKRCSAYCKNVTQQREGLWVKFVRRSSKWPIYDEPDKKANFVLVNAREGRFRGRHVKDTDWIELTDGRGYVHMWGWKFVESSEGTGLLYKSVV